MLVGLGTVSKPPSPRFLHNDGSHLPGVRFCEGRNHRREAHLRAAGFD